MDLLVVFILFVIAMVTSLVAEVTMVLPLLLGLILFMTVGVKRGFKVADLAKMGFEGAKSSIIVIEVMAVIGLLTAVWRMSGTITIFVYYGMKLILPHLFLLIAFLLSCLLSYALGTSFGVAGTVGVIFMTLARSGDVNPVLTAGVIMSGVYFGDRGSPVSSSATMTAGVTGTDILDNVKLMMKTAVLPFAVTLAVYCVLSWMNPIKTVDETVMTAFEKEFNLSLWAFVPAIIMLVLPLLKVDVLRSMGLSILSGVIVAYLVQDVDFLDIASMTIFGFQGKGDGTGEILNGGGLVSMVEIMLILAVSSMYSGIFHSTGMLDDVQDRLCRIGNRMGIFTMQIILSICTTVVFCNQTIAVLMCGSLTHKCYKESNSDNEKMKKITEGKKGNVEQAMDLENSAILIACTVPWSIGCSVPLSFMGAGSAAMLYACYMYLVPICYLFTKKIWFGRL